MQDFIQRLSQEIQKELPGRAAQLEMSPPFRATVPKSSKEARDAAVLCLLVPNNDQWNVLLMKRTALYKGDKHRGQVSFPGGKYETSDENFRATALRETCEEIGIRAKDIELLGELSPLFIPVSNFMVYPFVGYLKAEPDFQPDASEVEYLIEVPLKALLDEQNHKKTTIEATSGVSLPNVPFFDVNDEIVWGATAMMLSEFITLAKKCL